MSNKRLMRDNAYLSGGFYIQNDPIDLFEKKNAIYLLIDTYHRIGFNSIFIVANKIDPERCVS